MKKIRIIIHIVLIALFAVTSSAFPQELKTINLPEPETTGGMPFMEVLMNRQSIRDYSPEKIPMQEVSNILWAAWGFNRPEQDLRTAPSAGNRQEMTVYAMFEEGAYQYDAKANTLEPVVSGDIRKLSGSQDFVPTAPLNLLFIADLTKMGGKTREAKMNTAKVNAAFISQNVYLYCASKGLGTVIQGRYDRQLFPEALKLGPDQYITFTNTVGYPK